MSVKELMEITGKSRDVIIARIRKLFPAIVFEPRKKIELTENQGKAVLESYESTFSIGEPDDKPDKPVGSPVKVMITGSLIKELSKLLSRDELRQMLFNIPLSEGRKLIEQDKSSENKPEEESDADQE